MAQGKSLQVLLATMGSAGDVHPFIALGQALKLRGHRVTILTNPIFRDVIERQELGFAAVGSEAAARAAIADPDLWHMRKGFGIISQVIAPAIAQTFRSIEKLATDSTVVAFSTLSLGARVAQEKLGLASASVHLQPSVMRSDIEQGMLGNVRLSAAHPRWFKRGMYRLVDALILDRHLQAPLNAFRATLGLPAVERVMHRWMHSPALVIGFFPAWFAAPQADWPANTHLVGFPLWDAEPAVLSEAMDFLASGSAPVVVTPGSAGATMRPFFARSVAALRKLGVRAMLITNYPEQLPPDLAPGIRAFGYLPFSEILPHAALLVYHGGIGTLAQAVQAGVPHLVVPHAYDQYDSGWRVEQLGLGLSCANWRYRAAGAARLMRSLLEDADTAARCKTMAEKVDRLAASRAADLIEQLRK